MSALDQAIIKAYAKDRPAAAPVAAARNTEVRSPAALRQPRAHSIEQLYHDGSLYHAEQPTGAMRASRIVPAPHVPMLPPTSPRRNVRRSMLRLLANHQAAAGPVESPAEPPPRVARKVIIRHISHAAAPPPLGMLRSAAPLPAQPLSELAPEVLPIETAPSTPAAPLPILAPTPAPQIAPLNLDVQENSLIEVRGAWREGDAVSPMILVAETAASSITPVTLHLDALSAAEQAAWAWADVQADPLTVQVPPLTFARKSLEPEEPRIEIRVDAPHAMSRHRPHAKFFTPSQLKKQADALSKLEEQPAVPAPPVDQPEIAQLPQQNIADALEPQQPPQIVAESTKALLLEVSQESAPALGNTELTFAEHSETKDEPLASDLVPLEFSPELEAELPTEPSPQSAVEPAAEARPTVPLWEVDHFHWPRTCEKLFADESGYLARAGDKLLAAVQDGLRVLAVTGSRRGEGRSTLSLCLARAAARAGVQAAVMDADFARPQLASKIGLEIAFGWQDAALGRIPLSEAAVKSVADNVTLLPLESSAASRGLSLADPRVTATIRAAAATFELLILDLGPLSAGEQIAFPPDEACPLDAAIVVRDLRFATASESEAVGHALQDAGIEAVGIAENFVIEEEIPATSV